MVENQETKYTLNVKRAGARNREKELKVSYLDKGISEKQDNLRNALIEGL